MNCDVIKSPRRDVIFITKPGTASQALELLGAFTTLPSKVADFRCQKCGSLNIDVGVRCYGIEVYKM